MNAIFKSILFFTLFPVALSSYCQSNSKMMYSYDAAGNCISRTVGTTLLNSSLSPTSIDLTEFMFKSDNAIGEESFNVYPNPTKNMLFIELVNYLPETDGIMAYQLSDMKGSVLFHGKITASQTKLDLGKLPVGIYLLQIENGRDTFTWKIIKEN